MSDKALPTTILLLTPPFTQLNTPYPATAYLKGFLNTKAIASEQADLGIEVINALFCSSGLRQLFERVKQGNYPLSRNERRIMAVEEGYLATLDAAVAFLLDQNPTLAHSICSGNYLPEAGRFEQIADLEWAFGSMGVRDKARHLATLYLEDLGDLIQHTVDPLFGFSRYAERLSASANSFDELYQNLQAPPTFIDEFTLSILHHKLEQLQPRLVAL